VAEALTINVANIVSAYPEALPQQVIVKSELLDSYCVPVTSAVSSCVIAVDVPLLGVEIQLPLLSLIAVGTTLVFVYIVTGVDVSEDETFEVFHQVLVSPAVELTVIRKPLLDLDNVNVTLAVAVA